MAAELVQLQPGSQIVLPNGFATDQQIGEITEESLRNFKIVPPAGSIGSATVTVNYEKLAAAANLNNSGKIKIKLTSECKIRYSIVAGLCMLNLWGDFRAGDPWPTEAKVQAPDAASFGWDGKEYNTNVGGLKVLLSRADRLRGSDYDWKPFSEASADLEWSPVTVAHPCGNMSPAVINGDEKLILGEIDVDRKHASVAFDGKEHVFVGSTVHSAKVLCRKAKPESSID